MDSKSLEAAEQYHLWYYNSEVWTSTEFLGVQCQKSVADMWNYQEILYNLKPSLVIEFGTKHGGSALFFAETLRLISLHSRVLTVDIDHGIVDTKVLHNERIELLQSDSSSSAVSDRVLELRASYPGTAFFIVDSDHRKDHVLKELLQLRGLTQTGDYVVVEDSNLNGHPVLAGWGPGPFEALEEYMARYPDDYESDTKREYKFGFTFAPKGFLIRR